MASSVRKQKPTVKYTGARKRIRLWMMFMVVFFGWGIYTLIYETVQVSGLRSQVEETEISRQETEKQRDMLKQEIAKLHDPEYIGQLARKKQDMYGPGEVPIKGIESEKGE